MSTTEYHKLSADEIVDHVDSSHKDEIFTIEGVDIVIHPEVYPSQKFRTTSFVLRNIKNLVKDKTICDMGCGPGIVGLFSLKNGAKKVVQADINPNAIENAMVNNKRHSFGRNKIEVYQSNCFDNVQVQKFDIIIFNMPYHCDEVKISRPLERAFYDPGFESIRKFLKQVKSYMFESSEVLIAFSNKGRTDLLEKEFENSGLKWDLWKVINTDHEYDNRIYRLTYKD